MASPPWMQASGDGVALTLHIQPGAKRSECVGEHGSALKIRLAAPPVDGKANEALLQFIGEKLGIPKRQIELISGATSRAKRVRVTGLAAEAIAKRLAERSTAG